MRFVNIPSSSLPEIDSSVKECVNQGQWTLFRAEADDFLDGHVCFYLKVGKDLFALGEQGQVLTVFQSVNREIPMNEVIYFSDIPKPESLSNLHRFNFSLA